MLGGGGFFGKKAPPAASPAAPAEAQEADILKGLREVFPDVDSKLLEETSQSCLGDLGMAIDLVYAGLAEAAAPKEAGPMVSPLPPLGAWEPPPAQARTSGISKTERDAAVEKLTRATSATVEVPEPPLEDDQPVVAKEEEEEELPPNPHRPQDKEQMKDIVQDVSGITAVTPEEAFLALEKHDWNVQTTINRLLDTQ
eukprot:TRINITY_DN17148_c0_g1_i1.p1 TRINITY_DN17148_c0_g1~~TRINITY_DN17148_c0_g1_i1.p1  ORF type:complete len:220 (-),score=54.01 TRINITY_DN17148_c0_g1_i1:263-856(-)